MIKEKIKFFQRKKIEDNRGWFLKVITGTEPDLPSKTGEFYITVANPGQSKGGHYHNVANEWFTIITGECNLELLDMESGEELDIQLSEKQPTTIFVPSKLAHNFRNNSQKEFILLAYSDVLYDPTDTIPVDFDHKEKQ